MDTASPARVERRAIAVDIDRPFQRVLGAWLAARSYRVLFLPLSIARTAAGAIDLVVCEVGAPHEPGMQAMRELARVHRAPLIAISPRFVAGARRDTLGRQLGVDAALAKPFSRDDLYAALDALDAVAANDRHGGP